MYKYFAIFVLVIYPIAAICGISENKDISVSMQINNRNYLPGSEFKVNIELKNNFSESKKVELLVETLNQNKEKEWSTVINVGMTGGMDFSIPLMVSAPQVIGECLIVAKLRYDDNSSFSNLSLLEFMVHKPLIPKKLGRSMIFVPEWEHDLAHLVKDWDLKAPSISWGQTMLCSYKTWKRIEDKDKETIKLVERALKRQMSVIFLDFGPDMIDDDYIRNMTLPYDVEVQFHRNPSPETSFSLISNNKELWYGLYDKPQYSWNGLEKIIVPAVNMKITTSGGTLQNLVKAGVNPYRFPVVAIHGEKGKGSIVLSMLRTKGRLDEHSLVDINTSDELLYDPLAVQFVMNLISMSIDEKLLK
jgi:hypothetical protein